MDTFSEAVLFSFIEVISIFVMVLLISFQLSPTAGRYALQRSFTRASQFAVSYYITKIIAYRFIRDRTTWFLVQTMLMSSVVIYLLSSLVHMYTIQSRRWVRLYRFVWSILFIWSSYVAMYLIMWFEEADWFPTVAISLGFVFYDFADPILRYLVLIDDSQYWRNIENYLLPQSSFDMSSSLMGNDSLDLVVKTHSYSDTSKYFDDAMRNFKIPLIDFVDLGSALPVLIGKGGNAIVWKSSWKHETVAVKELKKGKIDTRMVNNFCREAILSARFSHKNILKLHGVSVAPPTFLMIFEWCNRGDLGAFLKQESVNLSIGNRLFLAKQCAEAISFFHSRGLVHRDLKPDNFLVHQVEYEVTVKLADFGSSRTRHDKMPIYSGISPLYAPPELTKLLPKNLKDIPKNAEELTVMYGMEVDVFSLGWVIWAILFEGGSWHAYLKEKAKEIRHDGYMPEMEEIHPVYRIIVEKCWDKNPETRPSAAEIETNLRNTLKNSGFLSEAQSFFNPHPSTEDEFKALTVSGA